MPPSKHTYSPIFRAFLKEATFTRQVLGAGATQIRDASYATQGQYFLAFTSLSTGLERLGKMCLILDHYLDHGKFPSQLQMKKEIGHKISVIYETTEAIVAKRGIKLSFLRHLNDPVHKAILSVLSQFAEGDRYSNINLLVGGPTPRDPIALWHESVDKPLFESRVSENRKQAILQRAAEVEAVIGRWSAVLHTSETGQDISSLRESSARTGVFQATAPLRQLVVVQIIRYWVEVLLALRDTVDSEDNFPHFGEIFAIFYNEDSYIRRRKTWLFSRSS